MSVGFFTGSNYADTRRDITVEKRHRRGYASLVRREKRVEND